jgi:hypothetical protein
MAPTANNTNQAFKKTNPTRINHCSARELFDHEGMLSQIINSIWAPDAAVLLQKLSKVWLQFTGVFCTYKPLQNSDHHVFIRYFSHKFQHYDQMTSIDLLSRGPSSWEVQLTFDSAVGQWPFCVSFAVLSTFGIISNTTKWPQLTNWCNVAEPFLNTIRTPR